MFGTFSAALSVKIILGACLMCLGMLKVHAEVLREQAPEWSANWLAAVANPEAGFVMRSSKTRNGNAIISLGELRCRKTVPEAAWKAYGKALAEDDRGHYSESFRLAMSAATVWPAFPQAHTALAVWYLRKLDLTNGEREIRAALHLDPYYLSARELLGILFLMRGEWSDARRTLEAVVASDFTRGLAQFFLARTLSELGESTLATDHLETAVRLHRHPPKTLLQDRLSFDPPN